METNKTNIINREQLLTLIVNAQKCVRVLGAVAFDLPYQDLKDIFYEKINSDESDFFLEIICESESSLSYNALISSDRRVSGQDRGYEYGILKDAYDAPAKQLRSYLLANGCKHLEPFEDAKKSNKNLSDKEAKQRFFLKTYFISPYIPTIQIDDDYYISYALTKFHHLDKFEKITSYNPWYDEFKKYFHAFLDASEGARKYATEVTRKGNRLEVLNMYDSERIPRGVLPRDSFMDLDSDCVKVVVWGLIFTRNGKLLLHKRGINAKDNRDMWDKSVGGHVDAEDIDTVKASAREIVEELYSHEAEGQGGHGEEDAFNINENYMIFLGEWRSDYRYEKLYEEIEEHKEMNYYFRMGYDLSRQVIISSRKLPDNSSRDVKAFVDLYVCVAKETFEQEVNEHKLQNSDYLLLYPEQIKDLSKMNECILNEEDAKLFEKYYCSKNSNDEKPAFELNGNCLSYNRDFKVTPDLKFIMNSVLWTKEISSFSDILRTRFEKSKK